MALGFSREEFPVKEILKLPSFGLSGGSRRTGFVF
jgi:hypothetical protein